MRRNDRWLDPADPQILILGSRLDRSRSSIAVADSQLNGDVGAASFRYTVSHKFLTDDKERGLNVVIASIPWFALCVYAAYVVSHRIENGRDRIAYYLLIWLVPFIGAAAAIILSNRPKPAAQAPEKMQQAIVDAHRQDDST